MAEIYLSTDVEADGPIPGPHSMLSFASAALVVEDRSHRLVSTFSRNLETLPGAAGHPHTVAWWDRNREAYEATRRDVVAPQSAMRDYLGWVRELESKTAARPVFVAYPATYDFLFVYWYLMRFAGESPFSHSGLDIKTYAMAMLKTDYRQIGKRSMPRRWFGERRHSHVALDDAIEQGEMFCRMLIEHRGTPAEPPPR